MNGRVDTTPSEVIRVLIEKNLDPNDAPAYQRYARLLGWADKIRRLHVRANADHLTRPRLRWPSVPRDRPVPHRTHVLRRRQDRPHA